MKKNYLILIFFLFAFIKAFSQNPIAPNIDNTSNQKYLDYSVSYNTGVPNIEVPLYTISSGEIQIPVYLRYHASGLKVGEGSGPVGAGWSLSTNYQISRSIRGAADEQSTMVNLDTINLENVGPYPIDYRKQFYSKYERDKFLAFLYIGQYNTNGMPSEFLEAGPSTMDSERDIFRYNMPDRSGRFIIENRSTLLSTLIDDDNGRTSFEYQPSFARFSARDDKGITYFFGENFQQQVAFGGTSAWLLTRIKSLKGDSVKFNYNEVTSNSISKNSATIYVKEGCGKCFPFDLGVPNYTKIDSASMRPISRYFPANIEFNEGKLLFDDYQTVTINGSQQQLLKKMVLKDLDDNIIRTIDFFYTSGRRVVFLDSIRIVGGNEQPMIYRFDYQKTDKNGIAYDNLYLDNDAWGYYAVNDRNIPAGREYTFNGGEQPILNPSYSNGDNDYQTIYFLMTHQPSVYTYSTTDPNKLRIIDYTKPYWIHNLVVTPPVPIYFTPKLNLEAENLIYLLKKITFPSGGSTSYKFTQNIAQNITGPAPGYRISEISSNDLITGNVMRHVFAYGEETGNPFDTGGYMINDKNNSLGNYIKQGVEIGIMPDGLGNPNRWMLYNNYTFTTSDVSTLDYDGLEENPVYYSKVTEYLYNNNAAISKTVYRYDTLAINNDKHYIDYAQITRNVNFMVNGNRNITRTYIPFNYSTITLGYKPVLLQKSNHRFLNDVWKTTDKEYYKYNAELGSGGGSILNVKITPFARRNGDPTNGSGLEGVYQETGIDSFFDFNVYRLNIPPYRRLSEKTVIKYTE